MANLVTLWILTVALVTTNAETQAGVLCCCFFLLLLVLFNTVFNIGPMYYIFIDDALKV